MIGVIFLGGMLAGLGLAYLVARSSERQQINNAWSEYKQPTPRPPRQPDLSLITELERNPRRIP